ERSDDRSARVRTSAEPTGVASGPPAAPRQGDDNSRPREGRMRLALRYAARTDVGLGPKTRNEDSGYAGPHLLAVADGMGGTVGGDVASATTIMTVRALDTPSHPEPLRALGQAAIEANARIAERIETDPHLEGMG